MNKGITVYQLLNDCIEQVRIGNGDKYVVVSDDDECNGYHTLFEGISSRDMDIRSAIEYEHDDHGINEIVVLT